MLNLQKQVGLVASVAQTANNYVDALESFEYHWNLLSDRTEFAFFKEDMTISEWELALDEANRHELLALSDAVELEKLVKDLTK